MKRRQKKKDTRPLSLCFGSLHTQHVCLNRLEPTSGRTTVVSATSTSFYYYYYYYSKKKIFIYFFAHFSHTHTHTNEYLRDVFIVFDVRCCKCLFLLRLCVCVCVCVYLFKSLAGAALFSRRLRVNYLNCISN
jgi:hypothetical protein